MKTIILLLLTILLPVTSSQALQSSTNYNISADVISSGGGESSSVNYSNFGIIGQPGIIGTSTGTTYAANHGFLSVLGDGFKILYPVISATPGILTFSIQTNSSANQNVSISNAGGSTLAWSITKGGDPGSIFNVTPSNGTNNGNVTVTANAAGLAPGLYHNTLTISGTGIVQTAQIQLDLTVTPILYTLAVTLKNVTPGKGGGTVTSTVPDSRLSCNNSGSSTDLICSADFPASTITLSQTPDSNTTLGTWGAPGCGSNPNCQITLNTPQGTTMSFPYSSMAKINSSGIGSESLSTAYGGAASNDIIKARAVVFPTGDLLMNSSKTIKLLGGLDAYYTALNGQYSTLSGKLTVSNGSMTVDKLKIK